MNDIKMNIKPNHCFVSSSAETGRDFAFHVVAPCAHQFSVHAVIYQKWDEKQAKGKVEQAVAPSPSCTSRLLLNNGACLLSTKLAENISIALLSRNYDYRVEILSRSRRLTNHIHICRGIIWRRRRIVWILWRRWGRWGRIIVGIIVGIIVWISAVIVIAWAHRLIVACIRRIAIAWKRAVSGGRVLLFFVH